MFDLTPSTLDKKSLVALNRSAAGSGQFVSNRMGSELLPSHEFARLRVGAEPLVATYLRRCKTMVDAYFLAAIRQQILTACHPASCIYKVFPGRDAEGPACSSRWCCAYDAYVADTHCVDAYRPWIHVQD